MIRVVVADDHPIVRQGVVALLRTEEDIDVVAEVDNGRAALSAALTEDPDVVLMDLRMPGMDGVEATKAVRQRRPDIAVLVLTTYDTDEAIVRAVEAGAAGYMLKDSPTEDLVHAVRRAAAGETVLSPPIAKRVVDMSGASNALTSREIDVLREVANGDTNAAIASRLHISRSNSEDAPDSHLRKAGGIRPGGGRGTRLRTGHPHHIAQPRSPDRSSRSDHPWFVSADSNHGGVKRVPAPLLEIAESNTSIMCVSP